MSVKLLSPTVTIEMITPKMAAEYLKHNVSNRALNRGTVMTYRAAMRAGEWKLSGQIAFDVLGNLQDGQHRLTAIVESGETITMIVARGLPVESQYITDTGRKRSAADALKLSSRVDSHASVIQGTARIAIVWDEGKHREVRPHTNGLRDIRNDEILNWVDNHPEVIPAAEFAAKISRKVKFITSAPLCFMFMHLSAKNHDQAERYFTDLADMRSGGTSSGDPIAAVFKAYERLNTANIRPRTSGHLYINYTAWNAIRLDRQLKFIPRLIPKVDQSTGRVLQYPTVPAPI